MRDPYRPLSLTFVLVVGLLGFGCGEAAPPVQDQGGVGSITVRADVWADNWFSLSLGERRIIEDSVPITTERSFNVESFRFKADYPFVLNIVAKDFRENDTGLEYIGAANQQMGDGGLIAQFIDTATGAVIAVTNADWRCLVVHRAPLDKACESSDNPVAGVGRCDFEAADEPAGWRSPTFDDRAWPSASEHTAGAVRPKGGYDQIDWHESARLVWSRDLEQDNTLLCRLLVNQE